jgi:hypothetical protein
MCDMERGSGEKMVGEWMRQKSRRGRKKNQGDMGVSLERMVSGDRDSTIDRVVKDGD